MNTDYTNKKVAVIGAGVEGLSSAEFFKKHGASVTIIDQNKDIKILGYKDIKLKTGKDYLKNLDEYDIIVRSPGVKLSTIKQALPKDSKTEITSQTKLFFDLCPCKIIGVTGTKGKGTTATLTYEMLKKEGPPAGGDAYLGGNIGQPPLDFLNTLSEQSIVVLELSSFQLQDLTKSPASPKTASRGWPHIAVLLMITSEHLDYHTDTYEYIDAKRNLVKFQNSEDFAIINRDFPASNESDMYTKAKIFQVSREQECEQGCFVKNGKIIVRVGAEVAHENFLVRSANPHDNIANRSSFSANAHSENFVSSPRNITNNEIINTKDILLPGEHNLENVCAAVMAATLAGVSKKAIVGVLREFRGLEHRLELVREVGGVTYYDDSFSTTPETAIAALLAFRQPEILILGGSSKGSDFSQLGEYIQNSPNIKAIIGIGVEWERMKSQFQISNFKFQIVEGCRDMREIVRKASEIARPGDIVLLSPACASFGMFKNYKDRGEQFKREVLRLK